ncbi:tRNA pseudouridine synthase 1 [Neolecta irregularis DAH-3]|uniref:tRNA pseudouridine synthase 1 n=1 Tax=Neolecta irregularis (strain DAH-3) TaxID=1198029 RepID=A0A1U7LUH1_NEOID|nr:tRNA pseudouridine synthase 1 [Neolecta irregularis DAH-3]|eukprot:OLL26325.1 tRNA pseudouridine synthase 1 [Neolecta irregularis DAH-3]
MTTEDELISRSIASENVIPPVQQPEATTSSQGLHDASINSGFPGSTSEESKKRKPSGRDNWVKNWDQKRTKREDYGIPREPRRPKKKVACLIGYCGTGYHGMQLNPPNRTIEGDLFDAFVKAGAISKDNSDDPRKSSLQRSARTDKGVHAAGNLISLKLIVEDADILEKINSYLPATIRLWGFTPSIRSFNCHTNCDSRVYEYLLPSHSFLPPRPTSTFAQFIISQNKDAGKPIQNWGGHDTSQFWDQVDVKILQISEEEIAAEEARIQSAVEEHGTQTHQVNARERIIRKLEMKEKRTFRITPERMQIVRDGFSQYLGSHNFHNFTVGMEYRNESARRFMKKITVSDPHNIDDTEWISVKIHGQSFMLHQIRKMVAMVVMIVRSGCPENRISEAYRPPKLAIPKAPGLGLLLERPIFEGYNKKATDNGREKIDFDQHDDQIEAFKQKHIYDKIYAEEKKENMYATRYIWRSDSRFHIFLSGLDSFPGFPYLTANGFPRTMETKAEELTLPGADDEEQAQDESDLKRPREEFEG